MAGSKKGERRGNARKRLSDGAPKAPTRAAASPNKHTRDYMDQIVLAVSGHRNGSNALPPREMIKEAQDYFHANVWKLRGQLDVIIAQIDACPEKDVTRNEQLSQNYIALRREIRDEYLLASDMAFKNLRYYHAPVSPTDTAETNDSPLAVLMVMLREIDELSRGRPTWQKPDLKLVSSK